MKDTNISWVEYISELQSIAQAEFTYSTGVFDIERYSRLKENFEISDVDFFDMNNIPPRYTHRTTANQLTRLYDVVTHEQATQFDG